MAVSAPPGMQPWIRKIDRSLADAERGLRSLQQATTRGRKVSLYDESLEAVTSPLGVTPDWYQMLGVSGPVISGEGNAERVKVTVSAVCEGVRNGTAIAAANGLMRATLQPVEQYKISARGDDHGGIGMGASFSYPTGAALTQRFGYSFSQVLFLPVGPYTVRSEYLYTQSTANIAVRWSQRTLMIEPF